MHFNNNNKNQTLDFPWKQKSLYFQVYVLTQLVYTSPFLGEKLWHDKIAGTIPDSTELTTVVSGWYYA